MQKETQTFTVTATPDVMHRLERFLAMLHYNSGFGHSNHFGMYLDGDGSEKIDVHPIDKRLKHEVDLIGHTGYDVEIANSRGYSGLYIDRHKIRSWRTGPAANLYKDGEIHETSPSRDPERER